MTHDVPEDQKCCGNCGRPRVEVEEVVSDELDIQLAVRRVVHHRKVYAAACGCAAQPFVRGAAPLKLFPRASVSVQAIAFAVTSRYMWGLPLHRLTTICHQHGADVPDGTLVGIFHAIDEHRLLQPVYDAICVRNRQSKHLHADETTWRQLWLARGKRGYIWCFVGADTTVFVFDPGRDHTVVLKYLGLDDTAWGGQVVELICDFMGAYDKAARVANAQERRLQLNRCWTHYRRLLVKIRDHYPSDRRVQAVTGQWLEMIGDLFRLHHKRDLAPDGSLEQHEAQAAFAGCLQEMEEARAQQLARPELAPQLRHFLEFGEEHWEELTRCAADPHQDIDNNRDEREMRHPVIIRKNAYGSGAEWAAHQTCQFLTIGRTLLRHGRNPLEWNLAYFEACARAGGQVPEDWERFLPWLSQPQGPGDGGPGSRTAPREETAPAEPEPPAGDVRDVAAGPDGAFSPEQPATPHTPDSEDRAELRDGAIPNIKPEQTAAPPATGAGCPAPIFGTAPVASRPTAAMQHPPVEPAAEPSPRPTAGPSTGLPAGAPLAALPPAAAFAMGAARPQPLAPTGGDTEPVGSLAGAGPEFTPLCPSVPWPAAATATRFHTAPVAPQSPPPMSLRGCFRRLAHQVVLRPRQAPRGPRCRISGQPP